MSPTKIIDFIIRFDGKVIDPRPISECYRYFQRIIDAKQVIRIRKKKRMIAFFTYWKVHNYNGAEATDEQWKLPENYTKGNKVFIDTAVIRPEFRNNNMTLEFRKRLIKKEPEAVEVGWIDVKNRLRTYPLKKEIAR